MTRKHFLASITLICLLCASSSSFAIVKGFVDNPQTNSADWTADVLALGSLVNQNIDFESHPTGPLQPDFYLTTEGVTLTGTGGIGNIVYGTGPDQGNTTGSNPGEGPNSASNYISSSAGTLTITFDAPTFGAGLFTIDKFWSSSVVTMTLEAFTGPDGTGTSLGIFGAPGINFQPNNRYFMGITSSDGDIQSVVLSYVGSTGGDVYGLDDIMFAGEGGVIPDPVARFYVTKTFEDLNTAEVEVTLTCNGGLPLQQSAMISGGDIAGVTFTVTEIQPGQTDCEVTETGSPDGYTVSYNNCSWTDVTPGLHSCVVENTVDDVTFTVKNLWEITADGSEVNTATEITIVCDSEITTSGATEVNGSWVYSETASGTVDSVVVAVVPNLPFTTCSASNDAGDLVSGVEVDDSACQSVQVSVDNDASCTITNTVFFEGIPTLSQYGLAILVLLTMSIGLVALRRVV